MPAIYEYPPFFDVFQNLSEEFARNYGPNGCGPNKCPAFFPPAAAAAHSKKGVSFAPAVDVFDTDRAFVVHASLPGASPNAISVDFEPKTNELILTGEIKRPGSFADDSSLKSLRLGERRVGKFDRRVRLSPTTKIAHDNITAKFVNGVLEVVVPKVEEPPKRKISIETVANPADDWVDASTSNDQLSSEKLD
ncbi:HSP20-like chaperone [Lipomyces kononenkoae]|uniref:HSP20-like chaperone n=1 Tax=Lipomyces kononenkoae TaxID=34357 RepID=A0ACC3SWZ8_LIPKO